MKKLLVISLILATLAIGWTGCQTTPATGKFPRQVFLHPPKQALAALKNGERLNEAQRLAIINYVKNSTVIQWKYDCAVRIWNHEDADDCF